MKKILLCLFFLMIISGISYSQVSIATAYNYPVDDSVLTGLKSIRGIDFADDPFGDGHSAFVVTNYVLNGSVSVFTTVGDDSIELVWTSPVITENGGGSTPRSPLLGDLDNDGLIEVIFQSAGNGIFIYEWDGVPGSYNFGTQPSQLLSTDNGLSDVSSYAECMITEDVDGDGSNELIVPYNTSSNATDIYYVISTPPGTDWSTDDPGFSSFTIEKEFVRTDLNNWGIGGGSPIAVFAAQLDGAGNKEILLHNWNLKNVVPVTVPAADTYEISDSTNGKQNIQLGGADDDVALLGGVVADIDGDGREEVYLPTYTSSADHNGWVHMIHYETGQSTSEIDETNIMLLDMKDVIPSNTFGAGYGDLDGNGKPNLYISGSYPYNLVTAEFQGGDKTDINNWLYSVVYPGEDDIYTAIDIMDSAGVIDTVYHIQPAFASKIYSRNTDFDKDGKEDILMPYQALNDSIAITHLTFADTTYDTTSTVNILNPKRWGFRILESDGATGIKEINLAVVSPDDYKLEQNYPNPFNPTTNIRFTLPLQKKITLKVYDILGNEVKTLIDNQEFQKGTYEATWDGTNNFGNQVASGQYIYTLKYGNFAKSMKMTLLK